MKGSPSAVLALNAGSSSLKFAVYALERPLRLLSSGTVERIGLPGAKFRLVQAKGPPSNQPIRVSDHKDAVRLILEHIRTAGLLPRLEAVGHRVLTGGNKYFAPHRIDRRLTSALQRLKPLGPEHLPAQLAVILAAKRALPRLPQVACFDTAFHRHLPWAARALPLPRRYLAAGVRRYGFHGLSYAFLLEELRVLGDPAAKRGRIILAHLGNGASLAAVKDGRSMDTTMGFTPAAGLVMGRRTGDLDPGLPAYFARQGMTPERFDRMVNHESGLLGLSQTTSDVRELLAMERRDPRAAQALEVFCYQARKAIGAMAAALGGLDTLVFAGGIGENSDAIRDRICAELGFLGLQLDPRRNAAHSAIISSRRSRVAVRVIRTDEDLMIARSTCRLLRIRG